MFDGRSICDSVSGFLAIKPPTCLRCRSPIGDYCSYYSDLNDTITITVECHGARDSRRFSIEELSDALNRDGLKFSFFQPSPVSLHGNRIGGIRPPGKTRKLTRRLLRSVGRIL